MPPEVNVSSLNPDRRRIVRDLLIIDDLVGYSKSGAGYVDGYATSFLLGQTSTGISLSPEAKGMLTDRTRPKTANQVSARQESRLTIQNKERYRQYQGRLNRPESHADLEAVLREIDNDRSISDARQKDYMKDCLIIDDLNGFRQDKTHYAQGYVYQALLGNLTGVSTETKLLINGSVDVVTGNVIVSPLGIANVKAQLLRELGTSREYIKLRDTLTTPYSNQDLLGALCQLDPREPFCLQILTIGPRVRPGEQNKTIRLTGLNLPDAAQVDISSPNPGLPPITVEPGSYVRIDDRQATIKVSVPDNFPANALPVSYSLTVASQNGLYRSTVTNAIRIVGAAGDPTEPGVPCESPRVCAIPYPPLKLFVAPETLMANNESQTLNIVGDGADSIKMIRLIVPATGTDVVVPITVSQEMFSDGGRRLSIRIALDPIKLAALFPDRAKGPFQLKLIVTDGAGQIVTVSNDLTIIVIQDRVIVERVPYQLPPLVHNVIRPDLSIGVSIQENSSSVPLVLGLNPGLIGKTAPIKSQYFELAAKGDCSFFSGEVVDGCRAQGYINIAYWGFKLESAGQAKYATSGSVYNLPYYYERTSFMTDGRFSLSYTPGRALSVRASGEWSYVKTMDDQRDKRFRLSGEGFITFGDGRSVYVPEKLNLRFGVVPSGERVVAGEAQELRGGGIGFDARWDRGLFAGLPLGLYFGWERISSANENNPHNLYGGVNFDLMRFIDRTVGYQDFSKYLLTQQH